MKAINLTVCSKVTRLHGRFDNLLKNLKEDLLITKSTVMPQAKETIICFINKHHLTMHAKQVWASDESVATIHLQSMTRCLQRPIRVNLRRPHIIQTIHLHLIWHHPHLRLIFWPMIPLVDHLELPFPSSIFPLPLTRMIFTLQTVSTPAIPHQPLHLRPSMSSRFCPAIKTLTLKERDKRLKHNYLRAWMVTTPRGMEVMMTKWNINIRLHLMPEMR